MVSPRSLSCSSSRPQSCSPNLNVAMRADGDASAGGDLRQDALSASWRSRHAGTGAGRSGQGQGRGRGRWRRSERRQLGEGGAEPWETGREGWFGRLHRHGRRRWWRHNDGFGFDYGYGYGFGYGCRCRHWRGGRDGGRNRRGHRRGGQDWGRHRRGYRRGGQDWGRDWGRDWRGGQDWGRRQNILLHNEGSHRYNGGGGGGGQVFVIDGPHRRPLDAVAAFAWAMRAIVQTEQILFVCWLVGWLVGWLGGWFCGVPSQSTAD